MNTTIGSYLRQERERRAATDRAFSLRAVARRVEVQPNYLSRIERDLEAPSERMLLRLAADLDLDPDVTLAMAGKVSADLQKAICRRPSEFAALIRELRDAPDGAILRIVRQVRDGEW